MIDCEKCTKLDKVWEDQMLSVCRECLIPQLEAAEKTIKEALEHMNTFITDNMGKPMKAYHANAAADVLGRYGREQDND